MTTKPHWFLPDTPDVLGMLRQQLAVTIRGMDALVEWAHGDESAAARVRELEHEADDCKRELQLALVQRVHDADTTPRTSTRSGAASTGSSTSPRTRCASRR